MIVIFVGSRGAGTSCKRVSADRWKNRSGLNGKRWKMLKMKGNSFS